MKKDTSVSIRINKQVKEFIENNLKNDKGETMTPQRILDEFIKKNVSIVIKIKDD